MKIVRDAAKIHGQLPLLESHVLFFPLHLHTYYFTSLTMIMGISKVLLDIEETVREDLREDQEVFREKMV